MESVNDDGNGISADALTIVKSLIGKVNKSPVRKIGIKVSNLGFLPKSKLNSCLIG